MKQQLFLLILPFLAFSLWAQNQPVNTDEPVSFVGMRLTEVIDRFGTPKTVFASRGGEIWQDDVVFQYTGKDFFIYKDRVWQVKFSSVYGIFLNDPKQAAMLRLGGTTVDNGDHVLLPLQGGNWPLMIRVNFTNGLVSTIYVYRSDF